MLGCEIRAREVRSASTGGLDVRARDVQACNVQAREVSMCKLVRCEHAMCKDVLCLHARARYAGTRVCDVRAREEARARGASS